MGYVVDKTFPPNEGTLYRFGSDYAPVKTVGPVTISNGLAWSLDNTTFYYIDSPTHEVFAYDYDAKTGDICKLIFFKLFSLILCEFSFFFLATIFIYF